ncbi:hypothetical protein SDC9_130613 [bioreactor metagenome]|uniref:Uncharacterized protein n=1 Tax=bioreactor metagenome TaxID=1076179 RepID=A0A645D2W7_9ZZZZ
MAECMAKVEHLPDSHCFGGVLLDIPLFYGQGEFNQLGKSLCITAEDLILLHQEKLVELLVLAEQGVLDHLGKPVEELLVTEGPERIDADEHLTCRIEGSDDVFHPVEIDGCLAPYRCIDHGEQGSGNQGKTTTAHVD